ncbi:hypothetical protein BC826DRAFT_986135, partial [Russula brevipes]
LSVPPTIASTITVAALDWTIPALRQVDVDVSTGPPDVLLIVDCIYHLTLVRPLLATMTTIAVPQHPATQFTRLLHLQTQHLRC